MGKDRLKVSIVQNSRFGIGDVTFLGVAVGKVEYIEDTLKRCTKNTLHLESGRNLTDVHNIIKSLGLLGDYAVDRLHRMKQIVGAFCEGDWRRVLMIDATGMNAANFTTFSTGIASVGFVRTHKYLHDYPKEFYNIQDMGFLLQLPINKAKENEDKPAYVVDVKFSMSAAMITEAMCPRISQLGTADPDYKYRMYHVVNPLDYFLDECRKSWDAYQEDWKQQGCKFDYIPYPYTREIVEGYFEDYNEALGFELDPNGPSPGSQEVRVEEPTIGALPDWGHDEASVTAVEQQTKEESGAYWKVATRSPPGRFTKI